MIFLTQALVNKPIKFELEAKKYFYNFFRKKRTDRYVLHTRFTFHSISLQSKCLVKSQKKHQRPTNKFERVHKCFLEFSDI
jgi:hypothetical protein